MRTVRSIVDKCGGRDVVTEAIGSTRNTVRMWEKSGIPEKHWAVVMRLHKGRLNTKNLHELNEFMRGLKNV